MGARTARFTAEDFVTPPEFAGLRLANVGGVRCELAEGAGRTRLGACYQQVPLRVLPPFQFPGEPAALLYLLNPTAGLLDGDAHGVELSVLPGARAVVTGQSANRVHPAVTSFATQQWRVRVAAGAHLAVLPGPTIPYRGCRYYQRVEADLEAGASLYWGDVWLPGRYARGGASEWFAFERIVQHLEVRREGELVYRERFDWRGPWQADEARWSLGGPQATGSLFVTEAVDGWPGSAEAGVERVRLPLACGDTCLRWCGPPPSVTAELVATTLRLAGEREGQRPWLVSAPNLAGNHWFSQRPVRLL